MNHLYLAIAGSPERTAAILCSDDGGYITSDEFWGFFMRETQRGAFGQLLEKIQLNISKKAGISINDLANSCVALSLAVSGIDHRFKDTHVLYPLQGEISRVFGRIDDTNLKVYGIAEAGYRAVLGAEPGLLVRSGAGCSVFANNHNGKRRLAAGLTDVLSAPGSAYAMGQRVFNVVRTAHDDIATPDEAHIAAAARRQANVADAIDLSYEVYKTRRYNGDTEMLKYVSQLASVLFSQAVTGNLLAQRMIEETSDHLFRVVKNLLLRLGMNSEPFKVFFQGTLFENHTSMAKNLLKKIQAPSAFPKAVYIERNPKLYYSRLVGAMKLLLCEDPKEFNTDGRVARFIHTLPEPADLPTQEGSPRELFWQPIRIWK